MSPNQPTLTTCYLSTNVVTLPTHVNMCFMFPNQSTLLQCCLSTHVVTLSTHVNICFMFPNQPTLQTRGKDVNTLVNRFTNMPMCRLSIHVIKLLTHILCFPTNQPAHVSFVKTCHKSVNTCQHASLATTQPSHCFLFRTLLRLLVKVLSSQFY